MTSHCTRKQQAQRISTLAAQDQPPHQLEVGQRESGERTIAASTSSKLRCEMSSPSGSSIEKETDTQNKDDSNVKSNTAKGSKAGHPAAWRLSCLAFALGCAWILLFPLVTVTTGEAKPRGTFFDENAMLVHHTTVKLTAGDVEWAQPGPLSKAHPQDGVGGAAWVCTVLRGMDLPCYTHTFYEVPEARSGLRESVYTVLESAPGADGKECMVITTAQNLSGTAEQLLVQPAFAGLSLSLSILKQLKDHVGWMSKRTIVLIADEDLAGAATGGLDVGIKSFIDDYHSDTLDLLERHEEDPNMTSSVRRGGVIRAAISLQYTEPGEPETVQLLTSGLNGELPNMDLLNAAVFHHERQGLRVLLDTCSAPLEGEPLVCPDAASRTANAVQGLLPDSAKSGTVQRYVDRLFSMLGFMGSVAMGPSGPHAHFLRHSVDALTIRGLGAVGRDPNGTTRPSSASSVPRTAAVLNVVRGVSNLEEELHHSFFSYLMLSTTAFVSIGEYAYALALLLVPLAVQGRRLTALNQDKMLLRAVLIVGTFEAFGALLLWAASTWPEPLEGTLSTFLEVVGLAGCLLVLAVRKSVSTVTTKKLQRPPWEGPQTVMACVVAYFCSVTALLNWPVAAVLALTHVPLLALASPLQGRSVSNFLMAAAMVMSSPGRWASILNLVSAHASGTSVLLRWLRWFRLSGLVNVPLMCLVSIPVHLTVALVLFAPQSQVDT